MTTEATNPTPPADELEPDAGAQELEAGGAQEEAPATPEVSDELAVALEVQGKRFSALEEALAGLTARVFELEQGTAPAPAAAHSSPLPAAAVPDAEAGEPGAPCPRCARAELTDAGRCPRCGYQAPAELEG